MWSSIEQIIKPDTLSEASVLLNESGSVIFAGGSYLVSQKDDEVHTLIDINHLIDDKIGTSGGDLQIDAGCTLQQILSFCKEDLSQVILASCPSKNIRNQRTIGGEIARSRLDSDLLVFLFAAGTKLILSHSETPIELLAWDGKGIIIKIILPNHNVKLERVALLDSAPAYIIVGYNDMPDVISVCVGGKIANIIFYQSKPEPQEDEVRKFLDHLGRSAYKRHVVGTLLQEMAGAR